MCKAWSDAQKDAERNGMILGTIDAWREVEISEAEIKKKIMAKYDLTEKEAAEYMLKKSA
ncbi:MAG: hypothetical protein LUI10_01815 [Lachnospiraceae bacterium]|nr:hypothetical protein [Lachnospiraceae bacterium]